MNLSATIITIGDELLIGQVVDTNSAWMGQALGAAGIRVLRRVAIGDDAADIQETLDAELPQVDLVLLTGGLGPTADDITKPTLAAYFGCGLRVDDQVKAHVEDFFRKRNRPMLDRNLRQAEVPEACTVLFNQKGTAPGMWFEKDGKIIVSLPGVPHEMMHLMETEVLPRLEKRFHLQPIQHRNILIGGEGESFIAEQIADLEAALPSHIKLAYLPSMGALRLRLTCTESGRSGIGTEMDDWSNRIAARLKPYVVAQSDFTMPEVLSGILKEKKLKLALAESCTGGYLAHLLTQHSGASACLQGSVVAYQPDTKIQLLDVLPETVKTNGVVSEAVALEMARGVVKALGGDLGLGVTGWLEGPGDNHAPGGTVCVATVWGNRHACKIFRFASDRLRNKELAAQNAFLFLIRFLQATEN